MVGPAAAKQLAQVWNGPVSAPNGYCIVTQYNIAIHLGDWEPDLALGGQQFSVTQPGQGAFIPFNP